MLGSQHMASSSALALALWTGLALSCGPSQKPPVQPTGHADVASPSAEPRPAAPAPASSTEAGDAAQPPERDPDALAALRRMGEFLREQRAFVVRSETSTDEVLEKSGQKIQLESSVELKARRPNRLRVDIDSDRKQRTIFYDGDSFTLFGDRIGYYAQAPAPPTIEETLAAVQARFGIDMPLVDLFYWGTRESDEGAITSALDIGPSRIKGVDTEHYAFRQPGVDFQVWIETGARPLPRKLVITTLSDPTQPQHSMLLTWTLDPKLDEAEFEFTPPPGAQRIVFEETRP